jgi:tetratricopeptide (TPR) repeat protein
MTADEAAGEQPGDWRYRAFVSYSHADEAWGRWVVRMLETWRIPRRLVGRETPMGPVPARLAPVFRDRDELAASAELGEHIQAALEESAALIVICSPTSARSRWVNEEILRFKRLGRARRIFALIVAGDPAVGDGPEQCFPTGLRFRLGADGELTDEPAEPAAADLRPGGDGKWRARLKLRAGLLGIDYDDLAQREHQRRNRRLAGLTAASLAGMLLTGYLAVTARIAREDADRNRERAEDLVGFMLGDLTDNLRAVGRLDMFDSVGGEALDYFESLDAEELTSRTLAQRADAMTLIGETAADRGDVDEAVRAFTQSVEQARLLAGREPGNPGWQRQLSDSELWLGFAYWEKGQLDDALEHFQLSLVAADRAVELDPGVDSLSAQSGAHNNIAQVLESRGELAAAREHYRTVLDLQRQVHAVMPDDADARAEVGFAHNTLGQVELRLGELASARDHYAQDLTIKRALHEADPPHSLWRHYLAMSEGNMAHLSDLLGDQGRAAAHTDRAIELNRELVALDPDNAGWTASLARVLTRRGRQLRVEGDLPRALSLQNEAVHLLAGLVDTDPAIARHRRSLADARMAMAETLADLGRYAEARAEGETALEVYTDQAGDAPGSVRAQVRLGRAELTLGQILARGGETEASAALLARARERLSGPAAETLDPTVLDPWIRVRFALEEDAAIEPDVERMLAIGYRQPEFLALVAGARQGEVE